MGFWTTLFEHFWYSRAPFLIAAYFVTTALVRRTPRIEKSHMRIAGTFVVGHLIAMAIGATQDWQGYEPTIAEVTALAFGLLGYLSIGMTLVFRVLLPRLGLELPLDIRGTAFQQRVWQALRALPPGTTTSYAELARRIGAPYAIRAVAGACAANALAVAIPCHRVVRTDGTLSGYRWGIDRKRRLLEHEKGTDLFPVPGK